MGWQFVGLTTVDVTTILSETLDEAEWGFFAQVKSKKLYRKLWIGLVFLYAFHAVHYLMANLQKHINMALISMESIFALVNLSNSDEDL